MNLLDLIQLYMLRVNIIIQLSLFVVLFKSSNCLLCFFFKTIARYCLDNGAHVDSVNKEGNTPLFCAAERFSSTCAKVKIKVNVEFSFYV